MKDQLVHAGLRIPSNSSTKYLERVGVDFDQRLGGNCVYQLGHMLDMLGPGAIERADILTSNTGGVLHYAAVVQDGRDEYYLDPYLMHTEPVKIADIFRGGVMVEAFPIGNKVAFQHTGANTFQATLYRPSTGVQFDEVRRYQFDLDQAYDDFPPFEEYATPNPSKMSMRVISPTADELMMLHYHLHTAGMNIVRYHSSGKTENVRQKGQPDVFEHHLQRMASMVLLSKGKIYDGLYQAQYYATEGYWSRINE